MFLSKKSTKLFSTKNNFGRQVFRPKNIFDRNLFFDRNNFSIEHIFFDRNNVTPNIDEEIFLDVIKNLFVRPATATATATAPPPLTATATATATAMYFTMYLYGGRSPPYN